jgi:hypothetical protein
MKVDDFGCYPANIKLLKSTLFPLLDDIKNEDVSVWLNDCHVNGLVALYIVSDKKYLQIVDFKQRLRQARGKYPLPNDGQLTDNGRPETKRNETESETESEGVFADDLKQLKPDVVKKASDLTEAICEYFEVRTIVTSKIYNSICEFISTISHRNEIEMAAAALQKYMSYKARSQQQKHNVLTWIGTKEDHYRDGQWIMIDWDSKNKNFKENEFRNGSKELSTAASTVIEHGKSFGKLR